MVFFDSVYYTASNRLNPVISLWLTANFESSIDSLDPTLNFKLKLADWKDRMATLFNCSTARMVDMSRQY